MSVVVHSVQVRLVPSPNELELWVPPTSGRARAKTLDEDYTILSTIHSAKGQEWRIVRLSNVVDGCIPSDMATGSPEEIEEERRMLYVAMTRAKDERDLIVPHRFYTYQQPSFGDSHVYASVSRFVPSSIRNSFDCRHWGGGPAVRQRRRSDLGQRLTFLRACFGCGGKQSVAKRARQYTDKENSISLSVIP
jgi:UvrD-like helicase C-terminal domain